MFLALAAPFAAAAQAPAVTPAPAAPARADTLVADVAGSTTFGRSSTRTLTARASLVHVTPSLEVTLALAGAYQDFADPGQPRFVAMRSGRATLSFEGQPRRLVSPVLWLSAEGSLEAQVARRLEQGLGLKVTPVRRGRDVASLSLAVVHTTTEAFAGAPANPDGDVLRWSGRLKVDHDVPGTAVRFSTITFWRPLLTDASHYTASSLTRLTVPVSDLVRLVAAFTYEYDTEATARGATSNENGTVTIGLNVSFRR